MDNYANRVKSLVTAGAVAARYGMPVSARGYMRCPFHQEKTASLRVYPGSGGWHCFGCGKGGSVIDFVQECFGLGFRDALKKLNEDFALGLPMGQPLDYRTRLEAAREARERHREARRQAWSRQRAEDTYWAEFDRLRLLDRWATDYRPRSQQEAFHPLYAYALHQLPLQQEALEFAEYERLKICKTKEAQGPSSQAS